jgi:hypothetical protein
MLLPEVLKVLDDLDADNGDPDADFVTEMRPFTDLW